MTPMTELLGQKAILCSCALEHTNDTNEAHLLVHGVISEALVRFDGAKQDLEAAMVRTLAAHAYTLVVPTPPA